MLASRAWAVDGQQIVRSDDGGASWSSSLFTSPDIALQAITFVDRETGWAVGGSEFGFGAALLHTTDGGATWSSQLTNVTGIPQRPNQTAFGFFDAAFTTAQHGVVVGAAEQGGAIFAPPPLIAVTNDAGAHWKAVDIESARSGGILRSVCLLPSGPGIAVGYTETSGGIVVVTSDGGETWTEISTTTATDLAGSDLTKITAAACAPPDQFWISGVNIGADAVAPGTQSTLLYSPDSGRTWSDRTPAIGNVSGATFQLLPMAFIGSSGWTIPSPFPPSVPGGGSPFALHTADGGLQWSQQQFPPAFMGAANAVAFLDMRHGVAVGAGVPDSTGSLPGVALLTGDGGETWQVGSVPTGVGRLLDVTAVP